MSTKFIAAKDLPVAEGDEVDVLCVENGALKRKEGASLGGGEATKVYAFDFRATGTQYFANEEFCNIIYGILDDEIGLEMLPYTIYRPPFGPFIFISSFEPETVNNHECVRLFDGNGSRVATVCFTEEDAVRVENYDTM